LEDYPAAEKYMNETLYSTKESWATPWICKQFTAGVQSTQRIESTNKHIHDKVDHTTSLCNLLNNIKDRQDNEEKYERFENQRSTIPTVGLPMLNSRFFGQVDDMIKRYLTPLMLGKQRSQINESVCYDVFLISQWEDIIQVCIL
jgi:hypothetical protein